MDRGSQREVFFGHRAEYFVDMHTVCTRDFAAVSIADEFFKHAFKYTFLVGHQSRFECWQVTHLSAVRKRHGRVDRDLREFELFLKRGSLQLGRLFFDVSILFPLASDRIVILKGKSQGVDFRMAACAACELLMFENGFANGGCPTDVGLVDQNAGGRFITSFFGSNGTAKRSYTDAMSLPAL